MNNSITTASNTGAFDAIRHIDEDQQEYWLAKELMPLLGYQKWGNFKSVIRKAEKVIINTEGSIEHHVSFQPTPALNQEGKGRPVEDYKLSRLACYLVAINGDSDKPEIALSQRYFATKAREAEIAQQKAAELKPKRRSIYDLHTAELARISAYQGEIKLNPDSPIADILVQGIEREFWDIPEKVAIYLGERIDRREAELYVNHKFYMNWFVEIDGIRNVEGLLAAASAISGHELFGDVRTAGKVLAQQELDRGMDEAARQYPVNAILERKAKELEASLQYDRLVLEPDKNI